MGNSVTFKLWETIDIARFEKEYEEVLERIVTGDAFFGYGEYKGLMAACDSVYEDKGHERWKAYCLYMGLMQPVLFNTTKGTSLEKDVRNFLEGISVSEVEKVLYLLGKDIDRPEDSEEVSEFEQYCEEIDAFPIIEYGYAYSEKSFFLHEEVEMNPEGFVGLIIQLLHVLGCVAKDGKGIGLTSTVQVSETKMYGDYFAKAREAKEKEDIPKREKEVYYQESTSDTSEKGGSVTIDFEQLERFKAEIEADKRAKQQQKQRGFWGKVQLFPGMWNRIIAKRFGKKVVPLFWIALVLLYLGNLIAGVIISVILYFVGSSMDK